MNDSSKNICELVLGDIHGHWKTLEDILEKYPWDRVILLGDYLDSFSGTSKDHIQCLKNILQLKQQYGDKVILLLGNHDFHYLHPNQKYSGYKYETQAYLGNLLVDAIDNGDIKIIHEDNKIIYSHAGISNTWFKASKFETLEDINKNILKNLDEFIFKGVDMFGDNVTQGPLWIRPNSLYLDYLLGYKQVVGHTPTKSVVQTNFCTLIDTLPRQFLQNIYEDGILISQTIIDNT